MRHFVVEKPMKKLSCMAAALAVLSGSARAAEAPVPRCLGAISSCIKIEGSLSMQTNVGFVRFVGRFACKLLGFSGCTNLS